MEWYGLNWIDIAIATFVLAIIPFALAAYGGHLAAEGVSDPIRRVRIKWCFWALFVFGVLLTGWQQFRTSEAELARNTREIWFEASMSRDFPPPVPPVIAKTEHRLAPMKREQLSVGIDRIWWTKDDAHKTIYIHAWVKNYSQTTRVNEVVFKPTTFVAGSEAISLTTNYESQSFAPQQINTVTLQVWFNKQEPYDGCITGTLACTTTMSFVYQDGIKPTTFEYQGSMLTNPNVEPSMNMETIKSAWH